eukprot:gb/GECG01000830.1/.p1 GENE.gb/GECG01000830.1/~~gb/GECG01000830.1/.p1  ORF type:complete len:163 (+),score=14.56 gb/GECG01000830.1/:1-489(+)
MSVPTENHIDLTQDSGSESSPEDTPDRDKAPARRRAKATKRRCTSPLETPAKHDYCSNGEYDQRSTEGYHASEKRLEVSRKTRANDIVSLRVVARPLQKPYTATGNGRWTFAIREFVSTKKQDGTFSKFGVNPRFGANFRRSEIGDVISKLQELVQYADDNP